MLYWAAVFFIIALIAAVLGFGGIAAGAAGIAKILFFIFLIAFVVSLLMCEGPTGPSRLASCAATNTVPAQVRKSFALMSAPEISFR